jgi:hypothetical protein
MDKNNRKQYNRRHKKNKEIGVIDLATPAEKLLSNTVPVQKKQAKKAPRRSLRQKLAVQTLPGHSLLDLYKDGK